MSIRCMAHVWHYNLMLPFTHYVLIKLCQILALTFEDDTPLKVSGGISNELDIC